jgi:hypothetical protein
VPAPALACQMFFPASTSVQPVTRSAPLNTGCADGAACQTTVWPPVPESAAVSRSGAGSRYTPSASWTTRSPDIPATIDRTAACAADSEHGSAAEQLVPVPDGAA